MPRKRSTKRKKIKSSDNVEGKNSLRFLSNKHKVSPSTTFREIYEQTSRTPCWEQVTAYMKYNQLPGIRVVSMDITWLGKIQGKPRWVLLVTDALSGDKVVYQPMDNQKAYTLVEILQRLKKTGYIPSIVIIDGAGALRTAVERVYPDAEIQRCLIHLQRNVYLSKELKPRKSGKPRKDGYTKRILLQVQKQLINAAWAWTKSERETAMQKLEELTKQGGRPRVFLQRLKKKLQFFHTFDEPLFAQFQREMRIQRKTRKLTRKERAKKNVVIRSTNFTERMCGIIKSMRTAKRGFGSIDSAYYLINEKMLVERVGEKKAEKLKRVLVKRYDFKPIVPYRMPPELYCNSVNNLLDLAHRYDLPLELLTDECKRMRLVIHDRYALTLDVAVKIKVDPKAISKHRKGKRLRLKLESFLTFDDLTAEQTNNLCGYFNFDKAPTETYRDVDRRALTRFNSEQLDHRVKVKNGLYSSLDIAKFLSYAKTDEINLYYSTQLRDPPLGIRAGDKKAIILPLKITGTAAQKSFDETPTLYRLLKTFTSDQRTNVYIQPPFSLKAYCESKKNAKNTASALISKPEVVQRTIFCSSAYSRRFSLREYAMRKR